MQHFNRFLVYTRINFLRGDLYPAFTALGLSTGVTGGLADDYEPYYADSFDGPTPPPPSPSASHLMVLTYEQPGEHLPYYSLQTVSTDPLQGRIV